MIVRFGPDSPSSRRAWHRLFGAHLNGGQRNQVRPALRGFWQSVVHFARPIAFQVERDIGIAEFLEARIDGFAQFDQAGNILGFHFDAGDRIVMAYAELPEAQFAQKLLAAVQLRQQWGRDVRAVRESGN